MKKSKTLLCIRKKRKLEIDINNNINNICEKKHKRHNLSCINNKSSGCITPESFNPLINYKLKQEKKIKKNENRFDKNKDHFHHMNPTEIFTYKPMIKRIFNINSILQKEKKKGKKLFCLKNVESKGVWNSRNTFNNNNKIKYMSNTTNNFCVNNKKIYEYEAPVISCKNYKEIIIN